MVMASRAMQQQARTLCASRLSCVSSVESASSVDGSCAHSSSFFQPSNPTRGAGTGWVAFWTAKWSCCFDFHVCSLQDLTLPAIRGTNVSRQRKKEAPNTLLEGGSFLSAPVDVLRERGGADVGSRLDTLRESGSSLSASVSSTKPSSAAFATRSAASRRPQNEAMPRCHAPDLGGDSPRRTMAAHTDPSRVAVVALC